MKPMRRTMWCSLTLVLGLAHGLLSACKSYAGNADYARITPTARGTMVETIRYCTTIENGVMTSFLNKLTHEEYLDNHASLANIIPHLPSGLGTQNTDEQRERADALFRWPWYEHAPDSRWPNQHYPDNQSKFRGEFDGPMHCKLTYNGLTDGFARYPDDVYVLDITIDDSNGDLLVTPSVKSRDKGVYGCAFTVSALAPAITIEAPIFDGMRLDRNMQHMLWANAWGGYWDYAFLAMNGYKVGAVAAWCQDAELKYYKHLFYIINDEGLSFSLSAMNIPPFDKLKEASPVTWRFQAFEKGWSEAVGRFRDWRLANVRIAPRPDWTRNVSFVNMGVNGARQWAQVLENYFGNKGLDRTVTFAATIRRQQFDRNHADNTPYDGFKDDMKYWKEKGPRLMAYLQPMIMWSPNAETDREREAVKWHNEADTRSVFQAEENKKVPYIDQHHLGHPGWQRWFLDWVKEYIQDYGADGVYHDQAYHCPIDARGLTIGGKTTTQGMAEYFYRAATENPNSIHGTEHMTEVNNVGASLGIGSGILWGTAQCMRHQRIKHASPVSNALHYPNGVIRGFPHFSDFSGRGNALFFHWGMDLMEKRAEIPGFPLQNQTLFNGTAVPYDTWVNELWLDRLRALTFVHRGLRPVFPIDWDRKVLSYFSAADGAEFRYESVPWGSAFVEIKDGARILHYGRITGVAQADVEGGITGWPMYTDKGPAGLHPDRYYCLVPGMKRPDTHFSPNNQFAKGLYEGFVEEGYVSEYFAYMHLRPIAHIGNITSYDNVVLHAPQEPAAVWVNGKPNKPQSLDGNRWQINFQLPADICVLLKSPPPGLDRLAGRSIQRFVVPDAGTDIFDSAFLGKELVETTTGFSGATKFAHVFGNKEVHTLFPILAPDARNASLRLKISAGGQSEGIREIAVNGVKTRFLAGKQQTTFTAEMDVPVSGTVPSMVKIVSERGCKIDMEWIASAQ